MAVSYQVVPMFQVTPEYPAWMKKGLAWWLWLGLLGWSLLLFGANQGYWAQFWPAVGMAPVMAVFSLFAAVTLRLQSRRKRRISDVTLMFWRSAMVCLLGCVLLWILRQLQPGLLDSVHYLFLLGLLLVLGVAGGVINGMLYKIVPFLSWFHLQHRQLALQRLNVPIPTMKGFISDRLAKAQFLLYLVALLLAICAIFYPGGFARPFALVFALSNLLLWLNLLGAVLRYRNSNRLLLAGGDS